MLKKLKEGKRNIDGLVSTQEGLTAVLEEENNILELMDSMGIDSVEELITNYPATAYYENVINTYYDEDEPLTDAESKEAVKKFYLERKSAFADAVEDFKNSEIYRLYIEVEENLKRYEKLTKG